MRLSLGCPPLPVTVTTRIITFLVGDPNLNLHLPQLLGGGTTQDLVYMFAQSCLILVSTGNAYDNLSRIRLFGAIGCVYNCLTNVCWMVSFMLCLLRQRLGGDREDHENFLPKKFSSFCGKKHTALEEHYYVNMPSICHIFVFSPLEEASMMRDPLGLMGPSLSPEWSI